MPEESPSAAFTRYHQEVMVKFAELLRDRGEDQVIHKEMTQAINRIQMDMASLQRDVSELGKWSTRMEAMDLRLTTLELDSAKQSGKTAAYVGMGGIAGGIVLFIFQFLLRSAGLKDK